MSDTKTEVKVEEITEEAIREEKRLYQREWRRKNPEKTRAINARYWAKRAARRLAGGAVNGD